MTEHAAKKFGGFPEVRMSAGTEKTIGRSGRIFTKRDRLFIAKIQRAADAQEKRSGRKIIVRTESRLSRNLGRIDYRNRSVLFVYINILGLRLARRRAVQWGEYADLYLSHYIGAFFRLAELADGEDTGHLTGRGGTGLEKPPPFERQPYDKGQTLFEGELHYKELPPFEGQPHYKEQLRPEGLPHCEDLPYFRGLAVGFHILKREAAGSVNIPSPGMSRMIRHREKCRWQTDDLFCELTALESVLFSIKEPEREQYRDLSEEKEMLERLAEMPEIVYDSKGRPRFAARMLAERAGQNAGKQPQLCEQYGVIRLLSCMESEKSLSLVLGQTPELTEDSFCRGLATRLCAGWDLGEADRREQAKMQAFLAEVSAEYERDAVRYVKNSIQYEGSVFRDNRVAVERTLRQISSYLDNSPNASSCGKIHSLGYR